MSAASLLLFIALNCLGITFLVLLHHFIIHGKWFDLKDICSHQAVAITLSSFSIGILLALIVL